MKAFLKILLLTLLTSLFACKGQNKNKMIEKLDIKELEKEGTKTPINNTEYSYELKKQFNDGSSYNLSGSKTEGGYVKKEKLPNPSFLKIYKEFYVNGNLKRKETYIGENVKIGISEYYDEDGTLDKKINEDEKFGKIKYTDCLAFLEKKGYIDLKTGKGREDKDGRPLFEFYFNDEEGHKSWVISIIKGKPNNAIPTGLGEPLDALPLDFIMDGETGKITEEK
ncbi:hypothetical protein AX766_03495 [Flavobacterium covae]|uniref:hypothetical protein n=1 Tax=Flavobacterium TaxID=237 RepID=UPI0007C190CD|nr:hypothetical protein [Flavobacterium covae]AND63534.1 hypothetical protein AX766_03495 [Flavobacterium covae]